MFFHKTTTPILDFDQIYKLGASNEKTVEFLKDRF